MLVLLTGLAVLSGAGWSWSELRRPHAAWSGESVDVVVADGMSAEAMFTTLADAGVLRRPGLLRLWLRATGGSERLQAGEYRFEHALSPLEVLRRLQVGDVLLHLVTIPEGLRLDEIAERLELAGFGERATHLAAFADPALVIRLDSEAADLEGYLFPDTYAFRRGVTTAEIVLNMVARFLEVAGPDYAKQARAVGLSVRQAVTLASLIERETSLPDERSRISAVFHNRLDRGMRLQCDPTVLYALHRLGRHPERLSTRDLEIDSPWNTYRVAGLPRGPIANAGQASLEAALRPLRSSELYFVAKADGGHEFTTNLADHNAAVARWRRYLRSSR